MDLFLNLKKNTTVLTSNRRLSATFLQQHHTYQLTQQTDCWQSLDILPFTSWIQRLWQTYTDKNIADAPLLLTPNQEAILWEKILQQSKEGGYLIQLTATAELAKSAWGMLKQWQVDTANPTFQTTEDSSVFQRWAKQFKKMCLAHRWIDTYMMTDLVIEKIFSDAILLPEQLILIGFAEIPPQYQALLDACQQKGTDIHFYQAPTRNKTLSRVALSDQETEIRTMACWAKALLEENQDHESLSIACIIPNLEKMRDQVSRIFGTVFSDESTLTVDTTLLPFNISAGKSLAHFPVIKTALSLLGLQKSSLSSDKFSEILLSPFLGDAEKEYIQRAQFDIHLRRANIKKMTLEELIHPGKRKLKFQEQCPLLAKRIESLLSTHASPSLTVSQWATVFMQQLNLLGWPGERTLNSPEYQVVQRWLSLINEFSALDYLLEPLTAHEALHYLTRLCHKIIFQPQSPAAPIQLLGILEAADLPFDHIWMMGLDDISWPPAAKPNPFIPLSLQKKLQMPHSTAERELMYCEHLIQQLIRNAEHLIFSYAEQDEECERHPSPLITAFDEITLNHIPQTSFTALAKALFQHRSNDYFLDETAPPHSLETTIRGGASLFKQQAACPFKAFSEIRLHARQTDPTQLGLRAQDRGVIVHKALELIWAELKDSETLHHYTDAALQTLVRKCIEYAIFQNTGDTVDQLRYLALEMQRLEKLIGNWLLLEKERPPFKIISQEQQQTLIVGKIPVTLRVDRIDEIASGKKIIIDYKTGKNLSVKDWFGNRPDEPQLPLYCLADPLNTIGIAFAQIHADNIELKGISQTDIAIPTIKTLAEINYSDNKNWEQQLTLWQSILEKLGDDFIQGIAKVDPKDAETCQYCSLQSFCRIDEHIIPDKKP